MLKLIVQSIKFHWDAHTSTPANFIAAVFGMTLNNFIFLHGMWLMLFAGKPENLAILPYSLGLWAVTSSAWGLVGILAGGLHDLGRHIENGTLDTMLATPRHPLLLVALANSSAQSWGDLLQGLLALVILPFVASAPYALRTLFIISASTLAFIAVFILAGSLVFFITRGSALGEFLIEAVLSLSIYPTGKMFQGSSRLILYLTPAAFTAVLPMAAIEEASLASFAAALFGTGVFLAFTIWIFQQGLLRYRSGSYVARLR